MGRVLTEQEEDDLDDIRREIRARKRMRNRYSCSDGFCGAEDCPRCHPSYSMETTDEEEDEDE